MVRLSRHFKRIARHFSFSVAACSIAGLVVVPGVVNAGSRWNDTTVGVFKYLFAKDLVNYVVGESVEIKASGACKAIGHDGGYAVYAYGLGSCQLNVVITNESTGRQVFSGARTVPVRRTVRSPALPVKSPIQVRFKNSRKCSRMRNAGGVVLPDWTCPTSSNASQIFQASLYDWFVGLKQERDFVPTLISKQKIDDVCDVVLGEIQRRGASLIEAARCDSSTRRNYESARICASKAGVTVIWDIAPVFDSKDLLVVTTTWQTRNARTADFADLVWIYTSEAPINGVDYSGLWSQCEELGGREPRHRDS